MKRCLLVAPAILLLGCGHKVEQFVFPDQITDFTALYGSNCAGCHGRDGRLGAARPLNDPVFLAVIGKDKLRDTIANGVPRTAMPAFAKNAGGGLTDQQITMLANQMNAQWSRPQEFAAVALPSYSADLGDPKAGNAVFQNNCASCHGEDGVGGKAGSCCGRKPISEARWKSDSSRTTSHLRLARRLVNDWSGSVIGADQWCADWMVSAPMYRR